MFDLKKEESEDLDFYINIHRGTEMKRNSYN